MGRRSIQQRRISAAIVIQTHYRAVMAYRRVQLLRTQYNAAVLLQRYVRGMLGRREVRRIRTAGNVRMINMIQQWKQMKAAVTIQRYVCSL